MNTIRDVARQARFSIATVSAVVNKLGRESMCMLFDEIDRFGEPGSGLQHKVVVLESELRVRHSTAPPSR